MSCSTPPLIATTCPYCGVGCGIDVTMTESRPSALTGTPGHPANFGHLCIKGQNLLATTDLQQRLLQPRVAGQSSDWPSAIARVASAFNDSIASYGRDSVAFYVSGQLLSEDYYVANKLMKGYIGSANIDTNSRLCMSSAVAAYKRAFGEDIVPCDYRDLELSDLVLLVGSNAAWTHPILFQRLERAKQINPALKVVSVDPRRTASAELADLHLPIRPGSDGYLFNGLLQYLADHQGLDRDFIAQHSNGFDACLASAREHSLAQIARFCGISETLLSEFYALFCHSERVVSFYSQGINQSSSGSDKNNGIINCHLASGKIGKPGCGPFSITGQPNAMGGREVGGLANTLAGHMELDNAEHRALVQNYWQSPRIAERAGFKALEIFEQIHAGKIKALWIIATNPMVSLPDRDFVAAALSKCPFVVVSDCVASNDTLPYADVVLPASTWSEKDGTVTNSERRISRQRGLVPAPLGARHDWQIICQVAQAMGFSDGFNFDSPHQIFSEYTALTGLGNQGSRALDLSPLSRLSAEQYRQLAPVQWPMTLSDGVLSSQRPFADRRFYTANGKANFIAISAQPPALATSAAMPFSLSSGRLRDHWHSMTRTGKTSRLSQHSERPELQLNPQDAKRLGIEDGDLVRISNASGEVCLNACLSAAQLPGRCFVPIHWNQQFASSANISKLFARISDPVSGQPELKQAPVALKKVALSTYAMIVTPIRLDAVVQGLPKDCHWLCYRSPALAGQAWSYQIYCEQPQPELIGTLQQHIAAQLPAEHGINAWLSLADGPRQQLLGLHEQGFAALMLFDNKPVSQHGQWLNEQLDKDNANADDIRALLALTPTKARGRKICSCFDVYEQQINDALASGAADSVEQLGQQLRCGSNCGSCKTELAALVRQQQEQACPGNNEVAA